MATNPVGYASAAAGTGSASGASSSSNTNASNDPEATKQQFISLLVAQLQNQDPLSPADGTQFLSQLTEINSLEQLLGIRQDLDTLAGQTTPSSGSGSGTAGSSSSGSSGNQTSAASGSQN